MKRLIIFSVIFSLMVISSPQAIGEVYMDFDFADGVVWHPGGFESYDILIRGEKGTAKSTAVRGLAELLPEIEVVSGCRFSCDPARPGDFCGEVGYYRAVALCREVERCINISRVAGP